MSMLFAGKYDDSGMCGRFSLLAHQELLRERFEIDRFEYTPQPQYNISPEQKIAVILHGDDGSRVMMSMRWGLIPFWTENPDEPDYSPINVRAETIIEKRMFKYAFQKRRCLVPASGFYEWKGDPGSKTPYYFHLNERNLFSFPGIYEKWVSEDEQSRIYSVTFATTTPNQTVERVHTRMPVILAEGEEELWLDPEAKEADLLDILDPHPDEFMTSFEVSTYVNDPSNEGPLAIKPIDEIE
ncbi:SOS response-associated peptidase [Candidatus Thorarchaeota archaeon]|nr:MAG: SOS response-associated peptidase [Candidatus Thorarchaeota archaeon]